jgi:helicase MOV-10
MDLSSHRRFIIARTIYAVCGERDAYRQFKTQTPYIARPRSNREPELRVEPGVRPPALSTIPWVSQLPKAYIPTKLVCLTKQESKSDILRVVKREVLPPTFEDQTYGEHFKILLWIEEMQMESVPLCIYDYVSFVLMIS